ncbi:hypothetical protein HK097_003425, partial [Rhizophlyctis rosea]
MLKVKSWVRTDTAPGAEELTLPERFSHPGRDLERSLSTRVEGLKGPDGARMKANYSLDSLMVEKRVVVGAMEVVKTLSVEVKVDLPGGDDIGEEAPQETTPTEEMLRKDDSSALIESLENDGDALMRPTSVPRLADAPPITHCQRFTPMLDKIYTDPVLIPIAIQPDFFSYSQSQPDSDTESVKDLKKGKKKMKKGNLPHQIQTRELGVGMRNSASMGSVASSLTGSASS